MEFDPTAVLGVLIPGRKMRRQIAGALCCLCHMRVHHLDAALLELPYGVTKAIHQPCAELLAEQVDKANTAVGSGVDNQPDA